MGNREAHFEPILAMVALTAFAITSLHSSVYGQERVVGKDKVIANTRIRDSVPGLGVALILDHSSFIDSKQKSADTVETALRGLGFKITRLKDQTKKDLEKSIKDFADAVPTQSVVVIYYRGPLIMGQQKLRSKYYDAAHIVPKDFAFKQKKDVRSSCVGIPEIEKVLTESGCKSFVLLADQIRLATDNKDLNKLQVLTRLGEFFGGPKSFIAVQDDQKNSISSALGNSELEPDSAKFQLVLTQIQKQSQSTAFAPRMLFGARVIRFVDWNYFADSYIGGKSAGEIRVNAMGQVFCWVPPGKARLGSPESETNRNKDERLSNYAQAKGFWCGKYEVTENEYSRVTRRNARNPRGKNNPYADARHGDGKRFADNLNKTQTSRLGSWHYAMPCEAEWEYACRAGASSAFCFGDNTSQLDQFGNFADRSLFELDRSKYRYATTSSHDGHQRTAPVGSFLPNRWGIHDMHGNVWEWCAESYRANPEYRQLQPDEKPKTSKPFNDLGRVIRGGSWLSYPHYCRSAMRNAQHDLNSAPHIGFRIIIRPD